MARKSGTSPAPAALRTTDLSAWHAPRYAPSASGSSAWSTPSHKTPPS
ncbi:hypothetical protein SAMN05428944_7874 [Streptomyces sp. 1222.5]|nr:hypothetical protein BX260_0210 [Streptomyces sp. 5112.2]SED49432.1 hypothetical protein SAMN05428944_7874 [Streptomyces sp. 1222.5]